jgi:hopanoid biosynthesis associated RND transporter like protein HpnN
VSAKPSPFGRIVAASASHPLMVLLLVTLLTAASLVYTARHFAMTTDTAELISTKLQWRQRELAFEAAFPQLQKLVIVVIDGATPELADAAAARLTAALAGKPNLFQSVRRPDGGSFFDHNGLLLLPLDEVAATTQRFGRARPVLGPLAADPSLRGVLTTISASLEGIRRGQAMLRDIEPAMAALAEPFESVLAGRPAFFSWRTLIGGMPAGPQERRRIVLVRPMMDYTALQPGAAASDAIRDTARSLGLDPAHGVTIRLTGPVPLADEEFATLAQDADLVIGAMAAALLGILWLAVRSARVVIAILVTTLLGLIMTTGLGLLATGRFNLISVAFIPLFVGLGIDFSIQFSVRYLAERLAQPDLKAGLTAAGNGVGGALALAAAAIGVGFFAFLPTSYVGVAELGTIAGLGMIIAFALSITLLPALLFLLRPSASGMSEVGYARLAPLESLLHRHRRAVLGLGGVVAIASAALLPLVRFDFDPLHLKSAKVESMTTHRDLTSDPGWTTNTLNVLAPSLAGSGDLVHRLDALPEVSRTITLNSFVPSHQKEKLALVGDAATLLNPILEVTPLAPPSDAGLLAALATTESALRQTAADKTDSASGAARRLAGALERLQAAAPDIRATAAAAVVVPLGIMLNQIHALLQAAPVTIETLPADLVADWITKDGRARIQVFPRAGRDDDESLRRFSDAIEKIAADATGIPISIRAAGDSIVTAFLQAGVFSAVAITALLALTLRRVRDVVLTMLPVLLSGLLTFALCAVFGLPLNFTNIIALPLLFGVGVAFNIYFVLAWRAGETGLLQSSLMRAVVFSALTTATAFGALWLSSHPGTASMGRLLMISLGCELLVTLLFRPALLGRPPADRDPA